MNESNVERTANDTCTRAIECLAFDGPKYATRTNEIEKSNDTNAQNRLLSAAAAAPALADGAPSLNSFEIRRGSERDASATTDLTESDADDSGGRGNKVRDADARARSAQHGRRVLLDDDGDGLHKRLDYALLSRSKTKTKRKTASIRLRA